MALYICSILLVTGAIAAAWFNILNKKPVRAPLKLKREKSDLKASDKTTIHSKASDEPLSLGRRGRSQSF